METAAFAARLDNRLAALARQEQEAADDEQRLMAERSERLAILERESERLHREMIRPRTVDVAGRLGASIEHIRTPMGFVTYIRCAHSPRYPASARMGIGIEWDREGLQARLISSVEILPILMDLPGDARLELEWDAPDAEAMERWIEERLLAFVDSYLRIASDPNYQAENLRSDPVCGMRVSMVAAPAAAEHNGRRYIFCSEACRSRFTTEPELYLQGKTRLAVPAHET